MHKVVVVVVIVDVVEITSYLSLKTIIFYNLVDYWITTYGILISHFHRTIVEKIIFNDLHGLAFPGSIPDNFSKTP